MGIVSKLENKIALAHKKIFSVKNGVICILVHCMFKDEQEALQSNADPQQSITVSDFENIIKFYKGKGYKFLSQKQLSDGIYNDDDKYCFLTFDDGYYNNVLALEILQKYKVPATFYFSTYHICEQKSFWWDAFYRGRKKEGASIDEIREEKKSLKTLKHEQIEDYLIDNFGEESLVPVDHTDRPMTVRELKDFAKNPYVDIGNHTHKHIILTNYSDKEIVEDIKKNQEILIDKIGTRPTTIAYPNGNFRRGLVGEMRKLGLKAGITTIKGKNDLPLDTSSDDAFFIKRHTPWHHKLKLNLELSEADLFIKKIFADG